MDPEIEELIRSGVGVIRRRDHPKLLRRFDRLQARGELVPLLPGYLVRPESQDDRRTRLRAGLLWLGPDAVVTEHAAARLTFWSECMVDTIAFAVPGGMPRPRDGWPVRRTRIPPEMQYKASGVPVTTPAYTAVDLAAGADGGDIIDRVLRSRKATLATLHEALAAMPRRAGNSTRSRLLRDSRDAPWSELERRGHRLLRKHGITGWRTNAWVDTADGGAYADVIFEAERLIVEFDGWEFHSGREAFESDRRRRNELVLAGYTVLNFTWQQVVDDPDWVISCIRRALGR
jgi:very-short-patch-repair endonuclease